MEGHTERSNAAISESDDLWQRKWHESSNDRWTHRLIPKIMGPLERKHGEANYQGGCYRQYLHRFGLDDLPDCPVCRSTPEDLEHVIFIAKGSRYRDGIRWQWTKTEPTGEGGKEGEN